MAEGGGNNDAFPGFAETPTQELLKQMADQNTRLLLLLERLSGQPATPAVSKRSVDQIVESLSSTIKEFFYDPAAGMTFDRWFNKYEDLFSADGRELDDAAKIRLLLRSLSVPVHEKFTNYLLPQDPRDFTFDQVIQKLKVIFGQSKSLFSKRYECFRVVKCDADDYVTYAGVVNRYCEDFDLANLTIDQFKALIFVCGLQSSKETEVRARLLSKLESDAGKETNLEVLITECQRLSNLKHDTALVEKNTSSSVQVIQQHKQHHKQPKAATKQRSSSFTLLACNRQGHKEGYCSCFNRTVKTSGENKQSQPPQQQQKRNKKHTQSNSVYSVNQVRSERKYVTTQINGHTVKLQLDCGSDITIISEQIWKKCGSPVFSHTEHRVRTASGEQLPLLGEFSCTMQIGEEQRSGTCYVTSVNNLNLFGLDFMNAFDVWAKPLTSICNQVNHSTANNPVNWYFTRFPEVFNDSLGHCTKTKVKLYLKPDAQPVFRAKRPVPFHAVSKVDDELDRLQRLGIISLVDFSDWAAPIVSVRKPGGRVRVCADYSTGLNSMLEPHHYPLPSPDDIFSKLSGNKVFSIIDLSDAYLQVEVDDESKQILTINTHRGLFQFNRLAPGVKSAPGAFQQLMSKMIAGLEGVDCFLDDFIVYSVNKEQHDRNLEKLFSRIQEYGFHLRPEKCSFYKSEIRYLGFIINADGIKPDPEKVASIVKMPQPKDVSELRSFLGAANFYGKFVRKIHRIRQPLDALLKKDSQFVWSAQCQEAFDTIKKVLQSDLLLTHYNPSLELIVAGDASKTGVGAVIMHRFPNNQLKAIAHASKTLTSTEQKYSQVEKEALALVFAVTKFRRMLLGRKFTLQTDHQPLLKTFGSKKGIPLHTANRLQRWALSLLGYDFNVEYVSTDNFGYADVLSRLISNHQKPEEEYIIAAISLEDEVNAGLAECFTSLPVNFRMVSAATKKDAILQFLQESFARFGIPATIITDNGTQFCSSEFKKLCDELGIIHIRTAPYHPQSNGQAERFVDTMKRSLRKIVEGEASGRRKLVRSHVNQLRQRFNEAVKPLPVPIPLDILVDDFQLTQSSIQHTIAPQNRTSDGSIPAQQRQDDSQTTSDSDEFFESEAGSAVASQAVVQPGSTNAPRPVRASRLPKRLEDYIVGFT
ncbi:uncharacterized protein K02A2.6-like [Sabethes cyaneus]|uniref:uncharacterized protein K02A2.6-like n=1 Tax=Sabethes cyaneus TaxID=53552 RepID=UPI00237E7E61|nr:uncharacterized protein K02A2.6-like [Sabethes cyaneus]